MSLSKLDSIVEGVFTKLMQPLPMDKEVEEMSKDLAQFEEEKRRNKVLVEELEHMAIHDPNMKISDALATAQGIYKNYGKTN